MTPVIAGRGLATTLLYATLVAWALIEVRQALNRRPGATVTDRGSLALVRVASVAGAVLAGLVVRVRATSFGDDWVVIAISLALMWAGIALRLWSFRTLGRYFTFQVMTSADQPVITSGPYRFVRHPSYTGILLILTGLGLSYFNWLSLAVLVGLTLVGLANRIRVEEAALSTTLGDRYTSYAKGRKRLVPLVW